CNIHVLEMARDTDKTIAALVKIIRKSIEEDRADTAVLGCLSMRGMAAPVQAEVKIPVVDPSLAALSMAQCVVQMKLAHSKAAYPFPQEKKRFL
ncbi:MAG TPA: aspartate/glutamate racemase family protein, partial [Thermodesulfobacteriota bacterium]|nr:aspartate/glutamate racemase family protein [Thermodesulfobacteriota bacterium]